MIEFLRQCRNLALTQWLICLSFIMTLSLAFSLMQSADSSGSRDYLLRWWPVLFVSVFIITIAVASLAPKTTTFVTRVSEGLVLAQSMGVVYILSLSIIDGRANPLTWFGLIFSLVIVIVSAASSFIMRRLPRWLRIILSLWSAFVVLIFAIKYIKYLQNLYQPDTLSVQDGFTYFMKYLLFGSATMYIASIALLLGVWLFYGRSKKLQSQRDIAVQRFSNYQMFPKETFIMIVYLMSLFFFQYRNPTFINADSIVWIGISTLPGVFYLVRLKHTLK
ncbi:hypothetical protein IPL68_00965 [Candidatus Saccharibacteria bacterium]|nr:MAG: hypothetical protein IPL68_00965 [Candidatus Saccharibacteria bacterium]